jgi:hypothetical protein
MAKSLKHYKNQRNKTRRLRKRKGGRAYSATKFDLGQLKREMKGGRHLFAVHSRDSCIHCKRFKPEWDKIVERLTPHPRLTVANLGPEETDFVNKEYYSKHDYGVNGVPTIVYYIVNKAPPREYHGERTADKIIEWLTKTMKENNLELTIKPKTDEDVEQPVSFEEPAEVPESQGDEQPELGASSSESAAPASSESASESAPASLESASESAPALEPPASPESASESAPAVQTDTIADAFPAAPLSSASIAGTVSTKANELNDTLKTATESATNAVTSTVSDIGNKLTNLFSSTPSTEAPAPAPAPAQAQTDAQEATVPPVPSLVGGVKRRKITRRKHRKSKSTRKSRKSRK